MLEARIKVVNRLGLHARAAAQLVRLAGRFQSRIMIRRLDRDLTVNAKSILSVLTLAAAIGTELLVTADGTDESEALEEIGALFANKFNETS